jgi:hypothetical protein
MDKAHRKTHPLIGMLAALYGIYLLYCLGDSMKDRYTVGTLTERMKTACVGRFLIDLPQSMDFSYSRAYMKGFWISAREETSQEFEERVSVRRKKIEAEPNQLVQKNLEAADDYQKNGFSGKIFRFGRNLTKGEEDGKPVDWVNVKLEAYVHAKGTSFDFIADGYDPSKTGNLPMLLDKLRLVPAHEIPTAAGFCFGPGILLDPLPADYTEGVTLFAGFADHPDLAMALDTRAGLKPDGDGRLERNARVASERPAWQKPLFTNLRRGKRTIHGIEGDEILTKVNELNFVTVYALDWEVSGTEHDVFVPFMHLEISTGHPVHAGAWPVTSFLGEEALIHLWDKIASSIRIRPSSAALPKQGEPPPGPRLGDAASAGDICPETGWWECKDGREDIDIAGGRRQFLTKGQRMPQALLMQPQTWWNKLRGVQASYQDKQPTGWILIDRRSRKRLAPAVQLAAAGPANRTGVMHGNRHAGPMATTGGFAGTGVPCPASGWWRCEDRDALDGTRWFAYGELLPPATFRFPRARFGGGTDAKVVQRRSRWQLVRQAPGHDVEPAAS